VNSRISVSAISTFRNSLEEDFTFWTRHDIRRVGVSVAKLEAHGWDDGLRRLTDAVDQGLDVVNLIGVGSFPLAHADQWEPARERLVRAVDAARAVAAHCVVFTTGPATPLLWEEAADALEVALAPVLTEARRAGVPFAIEHTNSLRVDVGFVHTLRDVVDLAERLDTGVCMEVNACWAERDLARTVAEGCGRLRLVQVSDFRVGTRATPDRLVPGDGDIPLRRILETVLEAGYGGSFDLEVIGPAIDAEGYDSAVPRAVRALEVLLAELDA
jgi:sugar phosphate isomerase/epimerase